MAFWQPLTMFTKSKESAKRYKAKVSKSYPNKQFKLESNVNKTEWRVLFKNRIK